MYLLICFIDLSIYIYIHIHICVYIYIYTYTYIHICVWSRKTCNPRSRKAVKVPETNSPSTETDRAAAGSQGKSMGWRLDPDYFLT